MQTIRDLPTLDEILMCDVPDINVGKMEGEE